MPARTIVVAGAGVGGLTAALALAARGFRVELLEKAEMLAETGAGIQLSPNATRILIGLGLRDRLMPSVVAPEAVVIRTAHGSVIGRLKLGAAAEKRFGAPYWIIHRGDLQAALLGGVQQRSGIALALGTALDSFAAHADGITVHALRHVHSIEVQGDALVGADGLWSTVRALLGTTGAPIFAGRTAWRALVPSEAVNAQIRAPVVNLWLGPGRHVVHYPVKSGTMINVVAIAQDSAPSEGWSTAAGPDEVLTRFTGDTWAAPVRDLLALPTQWLKWPLYDRPPLRRGGRGPVTLLGDAAHPMLPFLAQGAAMAIEDAAVLAGALAASSQDPPAGLRRYETMRAPRARAVWRAARRNDGIYHLSGPAAGLRNVAMRAIDLIGGLTPRYDWIYGWRAQ